MSSQGPRKQSDAVYRRRRIVVGILAVLALVGLMWLVSSVIGWFSGDEGESQEPTSEQQAEEQDPDAGTAPEETSEPSPEGEDDGGSDGNCAPGDVQVTALTGDESYGPMDAPLLIMEIEHTGSDECTLDVGTAQQTFVVSTEGREIFNTAQCGSSDDDDASLEVDFEPGQTERAQLTWPRSESATDCAEPADLEPGAYELTVDLGGISSEVHEFTLTEV